MRSCIFLFGVATLSAQIGLELPSFGCHAGADGKLRSFQGVKASLVASVPLAESVQSGLCSGQLALLQTGSEVVLLAGDETHRTTASERTMLDLHEGIAVAADPASGQLNYWRDGEWRLSPARIDPGILAVRLAGGRTTLLYPDQIITIDIVSGAIERITTIAVVGHVAAIQDSQVILINVDKRWLRCSEAGCTDAGSSPPGVIALQPLNREWFAATLQSGMVLAVRLEHEAVESFYLPGSAQE